MLVLWRDYLKGLDALKSNLANMTAFSKTDAYAHIRQYLNVHELMAVAVENKALDDRICYEFWSDELERAVANAKPVIEFVRSQPGVNTHITR